MRILCKIEPQQTGKSVRLPSLYRRPLWEGLPYRGETRGRSPLYITAGSWVRQDNVVLLHRTATLKTAGLSPGFSVHDSGPLPIFAPFSQNMQD